MAIPAYQQGDILLKRFISHFELGTFADIGERRDQPKNLIEKVGDAGLFVVEGLPRMIWKVMKDPKVVTVALGALYVLSVSFGFYPTATWLAVKAAVKFLPAVSFGTMKFVAYIFSINLGVSTALRAYGRFSNQPLMNAFYHIRNAQLQDNVVQQQPAAH